MPFKALVPQAVGCAQCAWDGRDVADVLPHGDDVCGYALVACPACATVRPLGLPFCCEFAAEARFPVTEPPVPAAGWAHERIEMGAALALPTRALLPGQEPGGDTLTFLAAAPEGAGLLHGPGEQNAPLYDGLFSVPLQMADCGLGAPVCDGGLAVGAAWHATRAASSYLAVTAGN